MIDQSARQAILDQFDREKATYDELAATADSLVAQLLKLSGVQLHSITHRCKAPSSLAAKLSAPEKHYVQLDDVTDLAGVRITTYFAEDVDHVAQVIEREFGVDPDNSVDKRASLDPDRFGYQSLHYVVSLSSDRAKLPEYARFRNMRFEIQIRSILQHAWAEIEHDLGYKSSAGVPRDIRRRFSRIAGLLELADQEFAAIRKELAAYAVAVVEDIRVQPESVGIDKISLKTLIASQSALRQVSLAVAEAAGAKLEESEDEVLDQTITYLNRIGISSIRDLEDAAATHVQIAKPFARRWLGGSRYSTLADTIGAFYLAYMILGERGDPTAIRAFFEESHIGTQDDRDRASSEIMEFYHAARAEGGGLTEG